MSESIRTFQERMLNHILTQLLADTPINRFFSDFEIMLVNQFIAVADHRAITTLEQRCQWHSEHRPTYTTATDDDDGCTVVARVHKPCCGSLSILAMNKRGLTMYERPMHRFTEEEQSAYLHRLWLMAWWRHLGYGTYGWKGW